MRLNNSFSKLLTVTAIVGSSLTSSRYLHLKLKLAIVDCQDLTLLAVVVSLGPSGGSGSSSSGGGSQSQVGGPGWLS
jgi:hypothetical protein